MNITNSITFISLFYIKNIIFYLNLDDLELNNVLSDIKPFFLKFFLVQHFNFLFHIVRNVQMLQIIFTDFVFRSGNEKKKKSREYYMLISCGKKQI